MEHVSTMTAVVGAQTPESPRGLLDGNQLLLLGVALFIWYIELQQRSQRGTSSAPSPSSDGGAKKLLRRYAPEALGFAALAGLAAFLLSRGDSLDQITPDDQAAWENIKKQWPLLTCADSLLVLQAMLRVMLLISALMRSDSAGSPLSGEPALLLLLAASCRVWLFFCSPEHQLEGPLQGPVHLAFEAAALPLLLLLCPGRAGRRPSALGMGAALVASVSAARFSTQHRLPLAECLVRDSAFTLIQILELLASGVCLFKTVRTGGCARGPCSSLTYMLFPVQQALALYFFLLGFDRSIESICVGKPLQVLQLGGAAQLVMLLLAAVVHFTFSAEEPDVVKPAVPPAQLARVVF